MNEIIALLLFGAWLIVFGIYYFLVGFNELEFWILVLAVVIYTFLKVFT